MEYSIEEVKDNQWWYSKSKLRRLVEASSVIELAINGRSCILQRSAPGKDGRETLSYKFIRDDDRMYWKSLNGTNARIEVVDLYSSVEQVEEDQEDEFLQELHGKSIEATIMPNRPSREPIFRTLERKTNFDAYIFVDWSANNTPKRGKDSIWIAEGQWEGTELLWGAEEPTCINALTREYATEHIRRRLHQHFENGNRLLVCFDFAYAYPECSESAVFGSEFNVIAQKLSSMITDDERNRSNRFQVASILNERVSNNSGEGPFWGRPTTGNANQLPRLKTTKPLNWSERSTLKEFRVVEQRMKKKGYRPFSVWQIFGNGSVGSQVLVGLPRVYSLRYDQLLTTRSAVWPFETGWSTSFPDEIQILHAEFWPGVIPADESLHSVRDACQVMSCVAWAASEDAAGRLGSFFDPLDKTDAERELASKEGWILGFIDRKGD